MKIETNLTGTVILSELERPVLFKDNVGRYVSVYMVDGVFKLRVYGDNPNGDGDGIKTVYDDTVAVVHPVYVVNMSDCTIDSVFVK